MDADTCHADSPRLLTCPRHMRESLDKRLGRLTSCRDGGTLIGQCSTDVNPGADAAQRDRHKAVADNEVFAVNGMRVQLPSDAVKAFKGHPCEYQTRAWDIEPVNKAVVKVLIVGKRPLLRIPECLDKH